MKEQFLKFNCDRRFQILVDLTFYYCHKKLPHGCSEQSLSDGLMGKCIKGFFFFYLNRCMRILLKIFETKMEKNTARVISPDQINYFNVEESIRCMPPTKET